MYTFPSRRSFALIALVTGLLLSVAKPAHSITYALLPETLPGGYTVNGSITTDGVIGSLSGSDILAWSWTASNGANTVGNSGNALSSFPSAGLGASQSALTLEFPSFGQTSSLKFAFLPTLTFSTSYGYNSQHYVNYDTKETLTISNSSYALENQYIGFNPGSYEIAASATPRWTAAAGGSWNTGTNWNTGSPPNGAGQQAVVGAGTTAPLTITLDGPQTLGTLTFMNPASSGVGYTLASGGGGSLTMDNSGWPPQILVASGSHAISANMIMAGSLSISPSASTTLVISGNISEAGGSQSLSLAGSGALVLSGSNTYSGGTTISGGTLMVASGGSLPSGSAVSLNGGQLVLNASQTFNQLQSTSAAVTGNVVLNNSVTLTVNPTADNNQFYGNISGNGSLVKGGSSHLRLFSTLDYTGSTTVGGTGGVLVLQGANTTLPLGTLLTINSPAEVDLTGGGGAKTQQISGLVGGGNIYSTNQWGTLDIDVAQGQSYTYAGNLTTGGGGCGEYVIKDGPGTQVLGGVQSGAATITVDTGNLTLTGSNTYSGGTTISGGTLHVGNGGTGASIGSTSGVLDNGSLVFNHADTVSFAPAISGSGSLTKTGTGALILSGTNSYDGGTTVSAGTLEILSSSALPAGSSVTVGAGGTLIFDASAAGPSVTNSSGAVTVPEPLPSALLGVGAIGLLAYLRRTRRSP